MEGLILAWLLAALPPPPYPDVDADEARIEELLTEQPVIEARTVHRQVVQQREEVQQAEKVVEQALDRQRQYVFDELDELLQKRVKLYADQSTVIEGIISELEPGGVTITIGKRGDSATFFVDRDRVRYARVMSQ